MTKARNIANIASDGSALSDGTINYTDVSGTPTLATVATSGAYADVTGTPAAALPLTGGTLSGGLNVSSGNVGIGTTSPSGELDVTASKASAVTNLYVRNPDNTGGAAIRVQSQTDAHQVILGITDAGSGGRVGTLTNDDFYFVTNNTERMRIDSAGRVTMPYQPSFVAGFTGGAYVTVPDANVIPFNYTGGSGAFDNGANFNTGTSRFTAPVTGRYFIQANCTAVSGGTRSIQIMKNGSAITNGADTIASFVTWTGASQTAVMSLIVYLAVGDYVDARTRNGSLDIYKNHTWFLGYLIG